MEKKIFQSIIGDLRTKRNIQLGVKEQHPKAMMSNYQMAKNSATVNCGGEWRGREYSQQIADYVMGSQAFTEMIKAYNAKADIETVIEPGKQYVQIRIRW